MDSKDPPLKHGWLGELKLAFVADESRTYLARKNHQGPLVIQKTLYPEGQNVCHGIILHPPGGVAGGDCLVLEADLDAKANVLLTTPGAGKWYKANNSIARQTIKFNLKENASIEWFPQENILFNGANVHLSATVELSKDSTFAGWDILCFGRQAKLEKWNEGLLRQHLKIYRDQKIIWHERAYLDADSRLMNSKTGLDGCAVVGSFIIAASNLSEGDVTECRKLTLPTHARYGLTYFNHVFCARYIGQSSEEAKQYFESLWKLLRPSYSGRQASRPRIWNT